MAVQDPGLGAAAPTKTTPAWQRWATGLVGVVLLIVAAIRIVGFFTASNTLPECDSQRAKDTLSNVFKEKQLSPSSYQEIKTISSSKDLVECEATLPADKALLDVKYKFVWNGKEPQIEYTIYSNPQ